MQVFDQKIKLFLSNSAKCWNTEHFFCNTLQNIWHRSNQNQGLFLYEPSCFYKFCLVFIYKRMALRGLEIFKWICFLKEWRAFIISYGVIKIIGMLIGWIGSNWILLLFTNVDPFLCYIWVPLYLYFDSSHFFDHPDGCIEFFRFEWYAQLSDRSIAWPLRGISVKKIA